MLYYLIFSRLLIGRSNKSNSPQFTIETNVTFNIDNPLSEKALVLQYLVFDTWYSGLIYSSTVPSHEAVHLQIGQFAMGNIPLKSLCFCSLYLAGGRPPDADAPGCRPPLMQTPPWRQTSLVMWPVMHAGKPTPHPPRTDKHLWKHYFALNFVCGR